MHPRSLTRPSASLLLTLVVAVAAPSPAAQWRGLGPEGGTIHSLTADPTHPGVLYAGGSTVFRSVDGGATWRHAGRGLPPATPFDFAPPYTLAVSGGVVYAGSTEIWRSVDGGASWQRTAQPSGVPSWARSISALVADPRQPGRVWAAGSWSIWLTDDGGAHWTEKKSGISTLTYLSVGALALDPQDGRLWAATRFGVFTATGDAQRWTKASEGLKGGAVAALAADPTSDVVLAGNFGGLWRREGNGPWVRRLPQVAYEIVFRGSRAYAAVRDEVGFVSQVLHSEDQGRTWTASTQQPDRFVLALAGSSAGVHAGTRTSDGAGGIYRSLDDGVTWQPSRSGLTNLYTEVVATVPDDGGLLFAAGDSQLSRSRDEGETWEVLHRPNSEPIAALVVEPGDPDVLYVAARFSASVFRSEDGGDSWVPTASLPHVTVLRTDRRGPRSLWALSGEALHHTTNGGGSWQRVTLPTGRYLFFRDLQVDPGAPATLWLAGSDSRAGAPRLFRSTDGGQTWTRRDTGLLGTSVASVALDAKTPGAVYAGTDAGLFRSTDAGQTWTRLPGAGGGITEVLAAPTTPTTIWVVTGPRREVRRSRDGGATWEWVRRGLDLAPVLGLAADTLDPERVYAGTGTRSVLGWEE